MATIDHDFDGHGGCVPACRACRIQVLEAASAAQQEAILEVVSLVEARIDKYQRLAKREREHQFWDAADGLDRCISDLRYASNELRRRFPEVLT